MAEQDCKSGSVISKAQRQYTVSCTGTRHPKTQSSAARYTYSPSINLKGDWLEQAGFDTGVKIDVRVMAGCLVITARQPEPEPEPEIMQTLRKVCKLSARKQRQVTEFIRVIAEPQKRTAKV